MTHAVKKKRENVISPDIEDSQEGNMELKYATANSEFHEIVDVWGPDYIELNDDVSLHSSEASTWNM